MQGNNLPGDSKSQSGCVCGPGIVQTEEFIKNGSELLFGNRFALIADKDDDLVGSVFRSDFNGGIRVTVINRIFQQVIKYSCQLFWIPVYGTVFVNRGRSARDKIHRSAVRAGNKGLPVPFPVQFAEGYTG